MYHVYILYDIFIINIPYYSKSKFVKKKDYVFIYSTDYIFKYLCIIFDI